MKFSKLTSSMILIIIIDLVVATDISFEEKVRLTLDLLKSRHTSCLYILQSSVQKEFGTVQKTLKYQSYFSKDHPFTSAVLNEQFVESMESIMQYRPVIFIDEVTDDIKNTLRKFSSTPYLSRGTWLVFENSTEHLESVMEGIHLPLDSEFLVAHHTSTGSLGVELSEVYRVLPRSPLHIHHVAIWNSEHGLNWTTRSYAQRRYNLAGVILKAGVLSYVKMVYITKLKGNKPVEIGGFAAALWRALESTLNFTTDFFLPPDRAYGSTDKNGTWTGLIGQAVRRDVDVLTITLQHNVMRLAVIDYFIPVVHSRYAIFIRKPDSEESNLDQLLKPLSVFLWYAVLGVIIVFTLLLTVTSHPSLGMVNNWQPGLGGDPSPEVGSDNYSLLNSFFYIFGIFCQTGHHTVPKSSSTRIVFIIAHIMFLVVFIGYSATFISFLTVTRFSMPFRDIKGLMDDGRYRLGLLANSSHIDFYRNTTDPILKKAYKKLVIPEMENFPRRNELGLARICERSRYAYMMMAEFERHLSSDVSCPLVEIPDTFFPGSMGFVCTKKSPLRRLFNYFIIRMYENGMLKTNEERLVPLKFQNKDEQVVIDTTLEKVVPVFHIYIAGILLALVFFLCEIVSPQVRRIRTSVIEFYN